MGLRSFVWPHVKVQRAELFHLFLFVLTTLPSIDQVKQLALNLQVCSACFKPKGLGVCCVHRQELHLSVCSGYGCSIEVPCCRYGQVRVCNVINHCFVYPLSHP